jgi:hypothetical protein
MALHGEVRRFVCLGQPDWAQEPRRQGRGRQAYDFGTPEYQLDANRLWDNIKTHAGWENEVVANIQAQRPDVFGSTPW